MGIIKVKFDGACHNKKGQSNVMGIGVAVFFDDVFMEDESVAVQVVPEYVRGTSNVAEWEACIEAWKKIEELNEKYPGNEFEIYSDSQIITNQFNGKFGINEASFLSYYRVGKDIQNRVNKPIQIKWVRRNFNKEADKLSKVGLKIGEISRSEFGNQKPSLN